MEFAKFRGTIVLAILVAYILALAAAAPQETKQSPGSIQPVTPADGHTIHVTAPHVVAGKVMGPYPSLL